MHGHQLGTKRYRARVPTLDDLDQDTGSKFVESFNLTMLSDPVDVEELKNIRNEKIKRSNKKLSTHSRNTMKG